MNSFRRWRTGGQGVVLSVLLLLFTGCTQPLTTRERGTLAGGVLGAVAGAVTADQLQAQDNLLAAQQREIEELRREV